MLGNILFWSGLFVALVIGLIYFRDLGDVSQMLIRVKRENMKRFIRHEYRLLGIGLSGLALAGVAHFALDAASPVIWWAAFVVCLVLYGFPYVWVHVGLRNQKDSAKFFSIKEASEYVSPSSQVLVMEHEGVARAYPQAQLLRPHLAGDESGLNGQNVVMTYCAMANLGIGYVPEVEGEKIELDVLAQHGNNLILRDNKTGEPIQQIYGFRDADAAPEGEGPACPLRPELSMRSWPTFRMTFRAFQKAYPDGEVFINKPSRNPLLFLFDTVLEMVFSSSIDRQHREAAPVMDNMTHSDDRLPNKTYVWGVNFGDEAVCWTDDFIVEQNNIVNAEVGGHALVVAWHPRYESLGVWYNDTGKPVEDIGFFGNTPDGQLKRVEILKPGLFWHVWVEFFPQTDINRVGAVSA